MNAVTLAKQAEAAAKPYVGILAPEILMQIKLAHVASWLNQQADEVDAVTLVLRARSAINMIGTGEFA